jgi:uncharacterized membrane protein
MPDERIIHQLAEHALERNGRTLELATSFLQEASVLVLVFGILDTYASGKLTRSVISIVLVVGLSLLAAAFSLRWICYRFMRRVIRYTLTIQERLPPRGDV